MRQEHKLRTACLAYSGMLAPTPQVVEAIAAYSRATIGDVVEISDEALAQGCVTPALNPYSFLILVFPKGEQEARKQDCFNYVQRTLGKTVHGAVWIEVQGETQRIWGFQCHNEWRADPPVPQSDGVHFTVELKGTQICWERMEMSWESPNCFDDEGEAELVARLLAIRYDGDVDTRVVSPRGVVLATFRLQKYLDTRRRGTREQHEALSPNATLPMLHEAREGYRVERAGKRTS